MSTPGPLDRRDPDFIRECLPVFARAFERYHAIEVTGFEHVPEGPALIVGNHNGGAMAPDMFGLMFAYWQRFGADEPTYGLMHDAVFGVPGVGSIMAKLGAVPARPENALELLARGARVLVYPGGDIDAFRASSRRNEIVFGERLGFVKIALRAQVPIVPVVSAGAHDGFHVFSDGVAFARRIGWKKLTRIEVFPVVLGFPFGLTVGPFFMYLPLPVRMKLRVLEPISWPELAPEDADDPAVLRRCQEEVRSKMQAALDDIVREGGFGRRSLGELL